MHIFCLFRFFECYFFSSCFLSLSICVSNFGHTILWCICVPFIRFVDGVANLFGRKKIKIQDIHMFTSKWIFIWYSANFYHFIWPPENFHKRHNTRTVCEVWANDIKSKLWEFHSWCRRINICFSFLAPVPTATERVSPNGQHFELVLAKTFRLLAINWVLLELCYFH